MLAAVATGWFLTLGLRYFVPAVLPQVTATFGIDNATAGLAVTIIWAAYALMQFPAGALADRLGTRTLLAASLVLAGASTVALGLAPTVSAFLGACGLFGLATGLYGPSRGIALAATFPDNDGIAIGATLAAGSVGSAALPFAASVLVAGIGWRLAIALAAPLFAVTALALWRALPPIDGATATERSPREALGAVGRAIRTRAVAVAVSAVTLMLFSMQGLTAFLPTYLVTAKGLEGTTAAGLFALLFLSGAVFQFLAGRAADRYGDRPVLLATTLVGGPAVGALPFVSGLVPLAGLTVLLGSRLAINSVSNAYVVAVLPERVRGAAWGFLRTSYFLLGATGSVVVGTLADAGRFDEAYLLLAGLTALAALLYTALPSRAAAA